MSYCNTVRFCSSPCYIHKLKFRSKLVVYALLGASLWVALTRFPILLFTGKVTLNSTLLVCFRLFLLSLESKAEPIHSSFCLFSPLQRYLHKLICYVLLCHVYYVVWLWLMFWVTPSMADSPVSKQIRSLDYYTRSKYKPLIIICTVESIRVCMRLHVLSNKINNISTCIVGTCNLQTLQILHPGIST